MARIRTIKPGFWSSEKLGKLPLLARLTVVGLISQADDEGRGRGATRFLMGTIHPYAEDVTEAALAAAIVVIHAAGLAQFYEVSGCRYYALPGWSEHQRIDHPTKSIIPQPPELEPELFGVKALEKSPFSDDSTGPRESSRAPREDSRQEEEGKGRGREEETDNNRPERRGPDDLQAVVRTAAKKLTATAQERAGDYGDYRLPKNFGTYAGAYVANVPADECQFLLDKMKPGPMVEAALRWRIAQKKMESNA